MGHEVHPLGAEELRERLSRITAVFIVVATLAAAIAGYLLALASRSGDTAAELAQRRAVEAADEAQLSRQWTHLQFASFVQAQEERDRSADAARRGIFADGSEDKARFRFEEERWKALAARTDELTRLAGSQFSGLQLEGPLGPDADPAFPARFLTESTRDSIRQEGLQDAANELSTSWGGKSTTYTAILLLFATALYLLGFSQAVRGRMRRSLAGLGVLFIVTGAVWSGAETLHRPKLAPDAAAGHYADGKVALDVGYDAYDNSPYRKAERAFTDAIRLRPSFAAAYEGRAGAEFVAESPQQGGFVSITTRHALNRAVSDERRALQLGLRNVRVLGNLGFYSFELGVIERDDRLLADAERLNRQALEFAPALPTAAFNEAAALLARRRVPQAEAAYRHAAELARDDSVVVAGAFTDLEFLRSHRPSLSGEIGRIKELVTATAFPDAAKGRRGVTATGLTIQEFPGSLSLQDIRIPGFDSNQQVVLYWYYDDPDHLGASVIPEMSGPTFLAEETDGSFFVDANYLADSTPARCLPAGTYRAELFVGGELAGRSAPLAIDFSGLKPEVLKDVDVAMCIPATWKAGQTLPGVIEGFVSPDGKEGIYVLRFDLPDVTGDTSAAESSHSAVTSVVGTFSGDLLPRDLKAEEGTAGSYFLGLDGAFTKYYDYPRGYMLIGAGVDRDQESILIGAVFGSRESFTNNGDKGLDLIPIFDSMVKYSAF